MKSANTITIFSRILLIVAAVLLATNIFLPIWQIQLYAPQYPEGLELLIYADKLAGDVEIINGLNHYIGMKTLHTEDFIEFSILRYIFGFFALCIIAVALIGRKKAVYIVFGAFVLFAVIAMADFYRWNYNYGHDLDPQAAIKVPGMAYQPPLIGYKQLLNFGAYSIPDTGGLLFIGAGILLLVVVLMETHALARWFRRKKVAAAALLVFGLMSFMACSQEGPIAVQVNKDACAFCKMTITDIKFATQLATPKGRHYIFDDISCMLDYQKANSEAKSSDFYIADFSRPSDFIKADQAILLHSDSLRSPMGGNIAGFAIRDSMIRYQTTFNGTELQWKNMVARH